MDLNKGEAVVAFIRRNKAGPDNYVAAVRRSESSFARPGNDFVFNPNQVPICEGGKHPDFQAALQSILEAVKNL